MSANTARRYREKLAGLQLTQADIEGLDDKQLDERFNKRPAHAPGKRMPDWEAINKAVELHGATRIDEWEKYRTGDPGTTYSYQQFTDLYRRWKKQNTLTMHLSYNPGEIVFVDFAGRKDPEHAKPFWTERDTGVRHEVEMYVACLGHSDLIFAYAVPSQSIRHWVEAIVRMYEFLGGVPRGIMTDNLKAAVDKPGRFPVFNKVFLRLTDHYRTSPLAARIEAPKDKAKVENGVKLVHRFVYPDLLAGTFYSIDELNQAILGLLPKINDRPFCNGIEGTRRTRFETMEKPALMRLPAQRFELAEWIGNQTVPSNYYVRAKDHWYSVPHTLVGETVEIHLGSRVVEILHNGKRVASHTRDDTPGGYTRDDTHLAPPHRFYAEANRENLTAWARTIGPNTAILADSVYARHRHPKPANDFFVFLRSWVDRGLTVETLETAAAYAQQRHIFAMDRFRSVVKRAQKGLLVSTPSSQTQLPLHENVRGEAYYR